MRRLEAFRVVYGSLQLAKPDFIGGRVLGFSLDQRARTVARVVGARQLAQAAVTAAVPTAAALVAGTVVDLLHAASMLGLAAADRPRRRLAAADAVVASAFAAAGVLAAVHLSDDEPGKAS